MSCLPDTSTSHTYIVFPCDRFVWASLSFHTTWCLDFQSTAEVHIYNLTMEVTWYHFPVLSIEAITKGWGHRLYRSANIILFGKQYGCSSKN